MACSRLEVETHWKNISQKEPAGVWHQSSSLHQKPQPLGRSGHIHDIKGSGGSDFVIGRLMSSSYTCKKFTRNIFQVSNSFPLGSFNTLATLAGVWLLLSSDLHLSLSRIETSGQDSFQPERMNCVILCRSPLGKKTGISCLLSSSVFFCSRLGTVTCPCASTSQMPRVLGLFSLWKGTSASCDR